MGKENKTVFVWDDLIVYVENHKESTEKPHSELISDCSKVAGYKVNIQKSIASLYTNSEQLEFEIKNKTIYLCTETWHR